MSALGRSSGYLEFVYTRVFERSAQGLLTDDEMRALELDLVEHPRRGAVERGTGGVRKTRATLEGRGKRGGARVVYLFDEKRERLYFLLAFSKKMKTSLTEEDRKLLRKLVSQLKE